MNMARLTDTHFATFQWLLFPVEKEDSLRASGLRFAYITGSELNPDFYSLHTEKSHIVYAPAPCVH